MQRKTIIISLLVTLIIVAGLSIKNPDDNMNDVALEESLTQKNVANQRVAEEANQKEESVQENNQDEVEGEAGQDFNQGAVRETKQATVREANRGQAKNPVAKTEQTQTTSSKNSIIQSRSALEAEVINLINKERKTKGLKPLETDNQVINLARKKSEDMRDNNYFSTKSPTYGVFTEMLKASNINYRTATEKIAGGYQNAQEVFNNWLKDGDFRKSILDPNFSHIGVGYASGGGDYRYYWTLWMLEKPAAISENTQSNFEKEVLSLVNIERSNRGLQPLVWDTQLAKVARAKSEDMRDKNYFAHQSPTYGSLGEMLKFFNVSYSSAAENIAAGQKTPVDVVKGWMNSEGHRKNILDPKLTHLGVGYADGGSEYFVYWTQIFTAKP